MKDVDFLFQDFQIKRDRFVANINRIDRWFFIGNGARGLDSATVELAKNNILNLGQTGNRMWTPIYTGILQLAGSVQADDRPFQAKTGRKLIVKTSDNTHTVFCQVGGCEPQKIMKMALLPDVVLHEVLLILMKRLGADEVKEEQQ